MMTSLYPQAWKLRMDRRLNIPTGNPALNKYTRCRYMVSWLPVLTPICQDGSVPAHMLVKLSLGHRCQAMIVVNGQLAQHCKSLLFWRGDSVTVLWESRSQECNTLISLDIQAVRIWTIEGNRTKSVSRKVLWAQVSGRRALPCPPCIHTHHPVSYAAKAFTQQVITFKQWNALFSSLTKAKTTLFSNSLTLCEFCLLAGHF